jgi:predicted pyridoxine 5'-phosphate oxidase superfamily flavin-nucleotide-binding protein
MQHAAGVDAEAANVAQIIRARLSAGARTFLALAELFVLAATDPAGRCWVTVRRGRPGFLRTTPDHLHVIGGVPPEDPLAGLGRDDRVGTLTIDLGRRRRFRANGTAESADRDGITLALDEAYGNCPKYIDTSARVPGPGTTCMLRRTGTDLSDGDIALVSSSSFFFIGSVHPEAGADASHRGGAPGFVRVPSRGELSIPDYAGNAMFNTLGNLRINPTVGLLFLAPTGDQLQVTGHAEILFHEPSPDSPEGRTVSVAIIETRRWTGQDPAPSPWNVKLR